MARVGLGVTLTGLLISLAGTVVLLLHVTKCYNTAIQDIGSIAVGYLRLIVFGVAVSVTGVALLVRD